MRRTTMLRRLEALLPGERIDGAVFAQTGPRPLLQLLVTLLPGLVASWVSPHLGLAWIGVSSIAFFAGRRWFAVAVTDRGVAVCNVFSRRRAVVARFGHDAFHGPTDSAIEPSVEVGGTTYWLRVRQVDEARRMRDASRAASAG